MKKILAIVLILIMCCTCCGCNNEPVQENFTRLNIEDLTASGTATVRLATENDSVPVGVGQDNPPTTETYIITFNGVYKDGGIAIDKSKISAGDYITFTYYYNRSCTPTFMNLTLCRIKGVVEKENEKYGKYTVRHFDAKGNFIGGSYKEDQMINTNLKGNYLTLEVYFETAPSEDLAFGCLWLNSGPADFYLTDLKLSKQSLMNEYTAN